MIRLREPIEANNEIFQEIEYNNQIIGSIYTYYQAGVKVTIYQTLVPNLEFYKKKYNWYNEQEGFMFIYFDNIKDLLRAKGIRC